MDGFDVNTDNYPGRYQPAGYSDPALLRPGALTGRLPSTFLMSRAEDILKVHIKGSPWHPMSIKVLARRTPGFTGVYREPGTAALLAARRNKKVIGAEEMEGY